MENLCVVAQVMQAIVIADHALVERCVALLARCEASDLEDPVGCGCGCTGYRSQERLIAHLSFLQIKSLCEALAAGIPRGHRARRPHHPDEGGRMSTDNPPTIGSALDLPPVIDLPTAARFLRIGRTTAHTLAARGALPVPVLRIGTALRVPTAPLLKVLGATRPGITDTVPDTGTPDPAMGTGSTPFPAHGTHVREDPPRPPLRYPAKWSVDQPRTR